MKYISISNLIASSLTFAILYYYVFIYYYCMISDLNKYTFACLVYLSYRLLECLQVRPSTWNTTWIPWRSYQMILRVISTTCMILIKGSLLYNSIMPYEFIQSVSPNRLYRQFFFLLEKVLPV